MYQGATVADDEDLSVRVHALYEWDCPRCGELNERGDIEPSGTDACDACGVTVTIA